MTLSHPLDDGFTRVSQDGSDERDARTLRLMRKRVEPRLDRRGMGLIRNTVGYPAFVA